MMAAGQVNTTVGRLAIQQDLERLRAWANRNLMKFDKNKCHSWEERAQCSNPGWDCLPGWADLLKKNPGGPGEPQPWQQGWPPASWAVSRAAQPTRSREGIIPPYTALVKPQLKNRIQFVARTWIDWSEFRGGPPNWLGTGALAV